MAATEQTSPARSGNWLANQPYLLLSITSLCWAATPSSDGWPPATSRRSRFRSCAGGCLLIILPFAWRIWRADWAAIRERLGIMVLLSITGIGAFNTLQYWALEHTQALNTLLLQSAARWWSRCGRCCCWECG